MTRAEALAALRELVAATCGHPEAEKSWTTDGRTVCAECGQLGSYQRRLDEQARHARAVEALAVLEGDI